ncbi:MAG: TolC family protein [Bacteroidetes bacterium]|nr:TolC family protein [Bacteroidota bacterium]
MKKYISIAFTCILFLVQNSFGQNITLEECVKKAIENYPLVKQNELLELTANIQSDNLSKLWFPQVQIAGQATYQSDVTGLPIKLPNVEIPKLSKDQYKLFAEINQSIYDGGWNQAQKKLITGNTTIEHEKINVELYRIKEKVEQLFFGILMIREQKKQLQLLVSDLLAALQKTNVAVKNGIALQLSADLIQVEILKQNQRMTELNASESGFIDALELFVQMQLNNNFTFVTPTLAQQLNELKRPELQLYETQKNLFLAQSDILRSKTMPRLNLFAQAGYGRPALNMLSNSFDPYAIGGLRLNWNISSFYTYKKETRLLDLQRQQIDIQKEVFTFQTKVQQAQQDAEIKKISQLIQQDDEIISLRKTIKNTAQVQLDNGVIQTDDYLRYTNAEDQAIQNKIVHQMQWMMAIYNYNHLTGN